MSGPGYNGPPSETRRLRQEAALKDKRIAELEAENLKLTLARPVYSRRQLASRLEQAETERDALRKQNEILSTTRRLEEEVREQAEAELAEANAMLRLFVHEFREGIEPGWYDGTCRGDSRVTDDDLIADLRNRL